MTTTTTSALMRPRSYAGGAAAADQPAPTQGWLLFVRQTRADAFALTAVAQAALFELQLDARGLSRHIDELGIEVELSAFLELFKTTLESRASVEVAVTASGDAVSVVLTYSFGASISRKGSFTLSLVAQNVPRQVVELLTDLHATPSEPVLSEARTYARKVAAHTAGAAAPVVSGAKIPSALASAASIATSQSQIGRDVFSQAGGADASAVATVNPQVLKRRHVPSGTVRRKGPKGAKLAKN